MSFLISEKGAWHSLLTANYKVRNTFYFQKKYLKLNQVEYIPIKLQKVFFSTIRK